MSRRGLLLIVAAAALAWLAWSRLRPDEGGAVRTLTVDRVHDLVALLGRAEVAGPSVYLTQEQPAIEPGDNRDRLAYLRCRPGASLTFPELTVGADPELLLGLGAVHELPPVGRRPVHFRVDVRDHGSDIWTTLLDEVVDPAALPVDSWAVSRRVALPAPAPGSASRSLDLRLSTAVAGEGPRPEWPGFLSPQVRSAGRPVALDEWPVSLLEVSDDLLARLGDARVDAPDRLGPSVLDAAVGVPVVGGQRVALRALAPVRAAWTVTPGPGTRFVADVGMDTESGWSLPGDGVVLSVEVDGEVAWSWTCRAPEWRRDRGWHPVSVDLTPWAGRAVELALVTGPRDDPDHDVAAWAAPRLVRDRSAPRLSADQAPTVVVLVADTLRADALGRGLTPHLDALAARGLHCTAARTPATWTWPATASLFTGLYPTEHGLQDEASAFLVEGLATLPEVFQRAGYTTGGFVSNMLISRRSGFAQGFETFVHAPYLRARALNDRVSAWLDDTEGTARLLYVHYMDPHAPYKPTPPFLPADAGDPSDDLELAHRITQQLRAGQRGTDDQRALREGLTARYDAEVAYLDAAVGELLAELGRRDVLEGAIVAFTADHGEEFLEHDLLSHGGQLFDETLAVPLIVTAPGLAPRRLDEPVITLDLLPTLCALADLPAPVAVAGRPTLHAGRPPEALFGQTLHGFAPDSDGWLEHLSIVRAGFKLVHTPASGRDRLYDLAADPGERRDLAAEQPGKLAALREELLRWRSESARRGSGLALDGLGDALQHMEQLGYVERGAAPPAAPADAPADVPSSDDAPSRDDG